MLYPVYLKQTNVPGDLKLTLLLANSTQFFVTCAGVHKALVASHLTGSTIQSIAHKSQDIEY